MGESFTAISEGEFRSAAGLFIDFNTEYGDPVPELTWLAAHLADLVRGGDSSVLLRGQNRAEPIGLAIVRFRTATWAAEQEAYLAEFYVAPRHRGHGVGRQFLTEVLDHARARGATFIDLNTSQDDEAARHLYEDFGFDCHEGRGDGPLAIYYERDL